MCVPPCDAALEPGEWQERLSRTDRFGILVVNDVDHAQDPLVVPTRSTVDGDELLLHLARPHPVWPHLQPHLDAEAATQRRRRLAAIGEWRERRRER